MSAYREALQDVLEWGKGEAGWHVWPAPAKLPPAVARAFGLLHGPQPEDRLKRDAERWRALVDPVDWERPSSDERRVESLRRTARGAVEDWLEIHPGSTR